MKRHQPHNVLVVDWDYFFPESLSWDWGHGESSFFEHGIWPIRAADFMIKGDDLPTVNDEWRTFWQKFSFAFGSNLHVADSNMAAYYAILMEFGTLHDVGVFSYDAHHDCGYEGKASLDNIVANGGRVTCENWMIPLGNAGRTKAGRVPNLHVVYPDWKTSALKAEPTPFFPMLDRRFNNEAKGEFLPAIFDMAFICRSPGWVPPWEDYKFFRFLEMAGHYMNIVAIDDGMVPRDFDRNQALAITAGMAKLQADATFGIER